MKNVFITMMVLTASFAAAQTQTYYFSPGTDSPKKALVIPLSINDSRYIRSWHFTVTNEKVQPVFKISKELPAIAERPDNWREILSAFFKPKESVPVPLQVVWEGKTTDGDKCPDGNYFFYFDAADDNNNYSETPRYRVVLDTTRPVVTIKPPAALTFGDRQRPALQIQQSGSREDRWTAEIKNEAGAVVRTFIWLDTQPANFAWDGKDNKGMMLPDGVYSYSISAVDAAGNKSLPTGISGIKLESITPEAEAGRSVSELAPNGKTKQQRFTIRANLKTGIASWRFTVVDEKGQAVREWARSGDTLPDHLDWDGRVSGGIAEGSFKGHLTISYTKGNEITTETPNFLCTGRGPELSVRLTPALFSPDGDGESDTLSIRTEVKSVLPLMSWHLTIHDPNGKTFKTWTGKSEIPPVIEWNGKGDNGDLVESAMDYPFVLNAVDTQEQSAEARGNVPIDILVMRDGNRYVIRVPAIIFRANNADFLSKMEDRRRGLEPAVIENNVRVLSRVAQILQKFGSYKVLVEGHANSETGTEREEVEELVPLSQKRAEFVRTWLTENGINASRLSAVGIGGRRPVMQNRRDRDNWWKNRRVEFILER